MLSIYMLLPRPHLWYVSPPLHAVWDINMHAAPGIVVLHALMPCLAHPLQRHFGEDGLATSLEELSMVRLQ